MEQGFSLSDMRTTYRMGELREDQVLDDPLQQFNVWMRQAVEDQLFEPNAMSIATVDADGQPSCRTVLLKGLIEEGFIFYTNYESRKGRALSVHPRAALLFWWREHERQVRVEGDVKRLPEEMSDDYFTQRPYGSRIAAMISPQSRPVTDRDTLERLFLEGDRQHRNEPPARPSFWGGFIVNPERIEFWQGRPNRLHDRILYSRSGPGWKRGRLAP